MVQTRSRPLTLEAFLELPETKPASDYLDGQIIQKPMPKGQHSTLQAELTPIINTALKPKKVARAFTELRCTFGGHSIVPDIAVVTWPRIPTNKRGEIANTSFPLEPDWIIEIISPDQNQNKVTKKILRCLEYSAEMGWLIDPDDKSVLVYQPQKVIVVDLEQPSTPLPTPKFANNLKLTVLELFELLIL